MEIKDGRGEHRTELRAKNVKKVKRYFTNNKNGTVKSCSEKLGLSKPTITSIVQNELR